MCRDDAKLRVADSDFLIERHDVAAMAKRIRKITTAIHPTVVDATKHTPMRSARKPSDGLNTPINEAIQLLANQAARESWSPGTADPEPLLSLISKEI